MDTETQQSCGVSFVTSSIPFHRADSNWSHNSFKDIDYLPDTLPFIFIWTQVMCSVGHRTFHTINHKTKWENHPVKVQVRLMYIPACTVWETRSLFPSAAWWLTEKTYFSKLAQQTVTPGLMSLLCFLYQRIKILQEKQCSAAFTAESFCLVVKWPDADQSGTDIKGEQRNKP